MEIALEPKIPTYSGGLGVLAGDMLRSAADLENPMVGVTLVHHKGYFRARDAILKEISKRNPSRGIQISILKRWNHPHLSWSKHGQFP